MLGDGVITPSISVLSALEGITVANRSLEPAVVPIACFVLVALFALQRFGTHKIGFLFSPIILLWCLSLAAIGIYNIVLNPKSLLAFNPRFMWEFIGRNGFEGIKMFGGTVLALTGCEAMYGDMGHFHKNPLRFSWLFIIQPAVILSYMGQVSALMNNLDAYTNSFYYHVPTPVYWPMFVLATLATIIASQALITGAFSLIFQAIQLGYFPPTKIYCTNHRVEGQIYIPLVNYILGILCLVLVVAFKTSAALADAFGLAVCGVLTVTTILFIAVILFSWQVPIPIRIIAAILFTIIFLPVQLVYLVANAAKFITGGWIPVLISAVAFVIMFVWKTGLEMLQRYYQKDKNQSYEDFLFTLKDIQRSKGVGVFFTTGDGVPDYMVKFVQRWHMLPEHVVLVKLKRFKVPKIDDEAKRCTVSCIMESVEKMVLRYGFFERKIDIHKYIEQTVTKNGKLVLPEKTSQDVENPVAKMPEVVPTAPHQQPFEILYYLERVNVKVSKKKHWLPMRYLIKMFTFMLKNSKDNSHVMDLPMDSVIEIGSQIRL